jgi:hypothetical protein
MSLKLVNPAQLIHPFTAFGNTFFYNSLPSISWGAHAPNPLGRMRQSIFCEAEKLTLLLLFWKRILDQWFLGGHAPKPPGSASPSVGRQDVFCEAELTLLLLFWKRRIRTIGSIVS